jgi:hypothetical protein
MTDATREALEKLRVELGALKAVACDPAFSNIVVGVRVRNCWKTYEDGLKALAAQAALEWQCRKCGAQADERFDCCEVHEATKSPALEPALVDKILAADKAPPAATFSNLDDLMAWLDDAPKSPALDPVTVEAWLRIELRQAMLDCWNSICTDTGCHPLDLEHQGKQLYFQPRHWADMIAETVVERLSHHVPDLALIGQPAPGGAVEAVAYTNKDQLGFLKHPDYALIPMAMWAKKSALSDIPLYAAPSTTPASDCAGSSTDEPDAAIKAAWEAADGVKS